MPCSNSFSDCKISILTWYCSCSLRFFRLNEHIGVVLLRVDEHSRNMFPFTEGSFLNNSFIYIYQLYNFTLSNMLFLKGSHISLRIASCLGSPTAISICLVSDNIKNKWARTNILPLSTVMKFPSVILQYSH